jgi:hypothetical protein
MEPSSAGVSDTFSSASGPPYGVDRNFGKAAMARSEVAVHFFDQLLKLRIIT